MGTLGHVAGDDWSLGCESLQQDRWQCGTRYPVGQNVPCMGCAEVMQHLGEQQLPEGCPCRKGDAPAVPPWDAAGAASRVPSEKVSLRGFFFPCQEGLSASLKASPFIIPICAGFRRKGLQNCSFWATFLFLFLFACPQCAFTSQHVHTEGSSCFLPCTQIAKERCCFPCATWLGLLWRDRKPPTVPPPVFARLSITKRHQTSFPFNLDYQPG